MRNIFGNTEGLKADPLRRLGNLYRRRVPKEFLITPDQAREIAGLSHDIGRQIGLLIDRTGKVFYVIVGDAAQIVIPDTPEHRTVPGRLKGLRCVHTYLKSEPLSSDDLTDLALLRLDMMAAVTLTETGGPDQIHIA
ncbi:MAG: GTPase HflX, partial [Thermodesulfobacteriota bacterium]